MTVYVDDMYKRPLGRLHIGRKRVMKMSHMIADTDAELHAMAESLGMRRAWFQGDHYDISLAKRKQAIALGAMPVSMRELVALLRYKVEHGHSPKARRKIRDGR